MTSDETGGDMKKAGWTLIRGGKDKIDLGTKESEILNQLRKYMAKAQSKLKTQHQNEYTFVVTARSITTRETVTAATREEAEKMVRERYPFAAVEWVEEK